MQGEVLLGEDGFELGRDGEGGLEDAGLLPREADTDLGARLLVPSPGPPHPTSPPQPPPPPPLSVPWADATMVLETKINAYIHGLHSFCGAELEP